MAAIEVVTAPSPAVPITPAEVRDQFKQTEAAEDGLLGSYIQAATNLLENWLRRAFIVRTLRLNMRSFAAADHVIEPVEARELLLPFAPLATVVEITYTDSAGDPQTWDAANYQTDAIATPGRVLPVPSESWPTVGTAYVNAARVKYTAGYASAALVPEQFKQLIRWLVALWYRNREPVAGAALHEVPYTIADWVDSQKSGWRLR